MNPLHVLIFSLVEGVTEFLPISSTGHLVLLSHIFRLPQTEFLKTFEIFIQLGAILSVVALYWKRIFKNKKLAFNVLLAFIPSALVGFALYPYIKSVLLGSELITILALFLGGVLLIIVEKYIKSKSQALEKIQISQSLKIGIFQVFSIIPGVSRAGATIIGGLFTGLSRQAAVEFSFLLAVPTMLGATGLDLFKQSFSFTAPEYLTLISGFILSFFFALISIKFLLKFIKTNNFIPFGIYRIILAVVYYLFLL